MVKVAPSAPHLTTTTWQAPEEKRVAPAVPWAVLGAAFFLLEAYILVHWLTSGNLEATPPGPSELPTHMRVAVVSMEVGAIIGAIAMLYFVLLRPWRRTGAITFEGMLCIIWFTLVWQDLLADYSQYWVTYNAHLFNLGSWNGSVPGWLAPNGHRLVAPLLLTGPVYIAGLFGATLVACHLMRRAKARWPQVSRFRLMLGCFIGMVVLDLIAEQTMLFTGLYVYGGGISWLTLFHGHYFQFPVYGAVLFGGTWACYTCLMYFRDDKGLTVVERGVDSLRISGRGKKVVRFLALAGVCNGIYLGVYNIPMQWFATHADDWPADIQNRSYFTQGLCGPGTPYACSGPGVPIARPDSVPVPPADRRN